MNKLVSLAKSKLRNKESSGLVSCGQVAAAIETKSGAIFSGVCIDTACSLGMCAERNAIGTMITEGEFKIVKLVCIKGTKLLLPCGACRELLMQLHPENAELEVLTNFDGSVIQLKELLPNWWA